LKKHEIKALNSWATGAIGSVGAEVFLSLFLYYFYNQVLGLSPFLTGLAIALSALVDAVTDPLIGNLSDKYNSSYGRRIPFMIWGIFPFSLSLLLLFSLDFGPSQFGLFLQLFLLIMITRISGTLSFIPRASLGIEMVKGYEDRNLLHAKNNNYGIWGYIFVYIVISNIFRDSWNNQEDYLFVIKLVALMVFITNLYSIFKLRNIESSYLMRPEDSKPKKGPGVISGLVQLWKNNSWRNLIIGSSLFGFIGSFNGVFTLYMTNYLWEWKPYEFFLVMAFALPGASIAGIYANKFLKKRDKKKTALGLTICLVLFSPILVVLRILDIKLGTNILPEVGQGILSTMFLLFGIHTMIMASLGTLDGILFSSMFSDVVEDNQRRTDSRSEGLIISVNGISGKLLGGLGILLSGSLLYLVGLTEASSFVEKQMVMTDLAIFSTLFLYIIAPIALFFISRYEINKSLHEDNLKELGYLKSNITGSPF